MAKKMNLREAAMANYIHKLQDELSETQAELEGLRNGIDELKRYLRSSKFYAEPYVNISDVFLRLEEAEERAEVCKFAAQSGNISKREYMKSKGRGGR